MQLFSGQKGKPNIPPPTKDASSLRTLKVLEEKLNTLNKKTEIIEDNILRISHRQSGEIKALNAKVIDAEKQMSLMKKRIVEIASDLKNFARREQVDTLRKYVEYWEPVNFVTQHELEEAIRR